MHKSHLRGQLSWQCFHGHPAHADSWSQMQGQCLRMVLQLSMPLETTNRIPAKAVCLCANRPCWRSSPPLDPPKCGQFDLLPTHSPHCQLQPCRTSTFVVYSQAVRWRHGVHAIGHSGAILHRFGKKIALSRTCSNPAAFQDSSCNCMMVRYCNVVFGGGGRKVCSVGDHVAPGCGC